MALAIQSLDEGLSIDGGDSSNIVETVDDSGFLKNFRSARQTLLLLGRHSNGWDWMKDVRVEATVMKHILGHWAGPTRENVKSL